MPFSGNIFIEGGAGTGKTTIGVQRYLQMVRSGIPAETILLLFPQRVLGRPYFDASHDPDFPSGGISDILTLGGLGQRLISLFWPMLAKSAGFSGKSTLPTFLTLETAQYYLARLVNPLIEKGYFESIKIERNRLFSQILDNLNKSALVGFDPSTISSLLKSAWDGEEARNHIYDQTQVCVNLFRAYCLKNNLLDYSLQMDTFRNHLWPSMLCRKYLTKKFKHLIYDNVEEDVPVSLDIIKEWLPAFNSAMIIYDQNGGYRSFLGADPQLGFSFQGLCDKTYKLSTNFVSSTPLQEFQKLFHQIINKRKPKILPKEVRKSFTYVHNPYYPSMVDWVCSEVEKLINEQGVNPDEIAILSPYLSDSLRFSITSRLNNINIPYRTSRPSRSLGEEPAARCLLTLARLAHPQWGLSPTHSELRNALMLSIDKLDIIRSDLLVKITYNKNKPERLMGSFDLIFPEMQQRITYIYGGFFETFRLWLLEYIESPEQDLDIFLSRLFGEVLSQPGFGFHKNYELASVAARLIESVRKFRHVKKNDLESISDSGKEYVQMVENGVIAAQYLQNPGDIMISSVSISPAYTFLMENRAVSYQFWLDIGSHGWAERLSQPLTHPFVLSRYWNSNQKWTDTHETQYIQQNILRLTSGLISRCRQHIYLCTSGINEQGNEQRGRLLTSLQVLFKQFVLLEKQNV